MEARLTDLCREAPILHHTVAVEPRSEPEPPHGELLVRIDRYLRAAGAAEAKQRSRLTAATARDLLAQGAGAEANWAEIVAAVDRSLAAELARDADGAPPRARGRVALALADTAGAAAVFAEDWGTPPRRSRPMRAQDLSLWQPSAERLLSLRLSRPLQGLAVCLCCLAVLMVP